MNVSRLSLLAAALMAASAAHATNGYFLPGFGVHSSGMGGVGIAYGIDSISAAANPANLANTGMRGDIDFVMFSPRRSAHVYDDPATPTVNGFFGTGLGEVDSGKEIFFMPNMGFSMPLSENLYAGVAFVANGGMNTTYDRNFFSIGTGSLPLPENPGRYATIGVDLAQLLIPVSVAYKPVENHSFGAAVQFAVQRFSARGIDAFGAFNISSAPNNLTGQGNDWSYGAGVRLGWQGDFFDDKLTLGATWASKTYMTEFDKYKGLFAEQGDFDIPSNFGLGIAFHPSKRLTVALDVSRILYEGIASVSNRGPAEAGTGIPGGCPTGDTCLGNDNGAGFGWEDQTVYKLGVNYQMTPSLAVRAGYNYGKSPITDDQLTFNTLAPATVEKHYSAGFTYRMNDNLRMSTFYMYVPEHRQTNCDLEVVDCVSIAMHQHVFGVSFGWVLDSGKYDLVEGYDAALQESSKLGFYGGVGFGQSRYRDGASTIQGDLAALGLTNTTSVDGEGKGTSYKLYAGYEFNRYLAVELGYADLNDLKALSNITAPSAGRLFTEIRTQAGTLGLVGAWPVTESFALTAKGGAAYLHSRGRVDATGSGGSGQITGSDSEVEPFYGLGVRYGLAHNLDFRAEWERYDSDIDIDMLSAGFAVKF